MNSPRISIICPIFNAKNFIEPFVDSILKQNYSNYELIIVDDGSTDGSYELLRDKYPDITVLRGDGNYWWAKSVNTGIKYALERGTDYILTINVDLKVKPDYLTQLIEFLPDDKTIIGSAQYDIKSGELLSLGGNRNWLTAKDLKNQPQEGKILYSVSHFCGRGLFIPKTAFKEIGYFDEKRFPQYASDDVFTFTAVKQGYKIYCNMNAKVFIFNKHTGKTHFRTKPSLIKLFKYFTNIKSSSNLKIRWRMAVIVAPRQYLLIYIIMDTIREIGSYFRVLLKDKLNEIRNNHPRQK